MRKPDFFIVGAPKCGTTFLYEHLQGHPEICLPKKEFHHFGKDLRPAAYQGHKWDRATYLDLFKDATTEKRVGEASVWYLFSQYAAREIKVFAPEADIIIMLRNPIDMMASLYNLFLWVADLTPNGVIDAHTERVLSFEEALQNQDARKQELHSTVDAVAMEGRRVLRIFHTDAAHYADQVQRYLDTFDRQHLHFIFYDDIRANPAQSFRETLQFLQVDPDYQPDFEVVNSNRHIGNIKLHRRLNEHDSLGWIRALGRVLVPVAWRKQAYQYLQNRNVKHEKRAPMHPETRAWLREHFRADVERLSQMLDKDLVSLWLNPPSHTPAPDPLTGNAAIPPITSSS